jgi:predicted transposase YbfD/YdcC
MQSTDLVPVLDILPDEQREALLTDRTLRSLADVLATLPDPRSCHGKRYELPMLLTCLVAALLCGCNSLEAVGGWCRHEQPLLRRLFGRRRHLTPSGSLYRWLLPRLDAAHLEWALSGWILTTRPQRDREAVALDGKVVCGTGHGGAKGLQLVSVSTHQTSETLLQVPIAAKTNEIPAAQAILPWLLLGGRVVTADALHCQRAFAQAVLDGGADYLLCVKGNQGTLYRDIVELFADPFSTCTTAHTVDRQHGRRETRTVRATTELNTYIQSFPAVGQVIQMTRTVEDATPIGTTTSRVSPRTRQHRIVFFP